MNRLRLLLVSIVWAALAGESWATVALEFSNTSTGAIASGFADSAGVPTDGMAWGIVVDTSASQDGLYGTGSATYDAYATPAVAGFLSVGGQVTTDYFIPAAAFADSPTTANSSGLFPLDGGHGTILDTTSGNISLTGGVAAGQRFALIWLPSGTMNQDDRCGMFTNAAFVLPGDSGIMDYSAVFAGPDAARPANLTIGTPGGGTAAVKPTVASPTAVTTSGTAVTLGGRVFSDGGATITARGVVYALAATNSNPRIGGTGATNVTGTGTTGVFTVTASGLTPGASYAFAAYATNSVGTSYSSTGNFTVLNPVGTLAFSQSLYPVNSGTAATTIDVVVTRSGGTPTSIVGCVLNTTDGTAKNPAHYTKQLNVPISFGNNDTTPKVVSIPISANASTTIAKTFTVTLSGQTGGASLGTQASATVAILPLLAKPDTAKPTVTITAPANASTQNDLPGSLTVTGKATDVVGVNKVQVSVDNGVNFNDAALTYAPATGAGSVNYTFAITPVTGTNTIQVKSTDFSNNVSAVATTSFTQLRTLAVIAAAATTTTAGGTVTAGFAPSSSRQAGKSYTITATPSATMPTASGSSIFNGWTVSRATNASISVAASALEKQTLTFTFREGLVLTARFAANPFKAHAGTYNGLVRSSASAPTVAGTAPSNSTEGCFSATMTSTGTFTGKLTIDTVVLNVAGAFDANGDARFGTARLRSLIVPSTNGKPSFVLDAVHLNTTTAQMTANVTATDYQASQVTAVSTITADRAYYDGLTPATTVPAAYLDTAGANGVFTIAFPHLPLTGSTPGDHQPARITTAGFMTQDYPQGDGVGLITVTKAGSVSLAATLADGTAVTASSTLRLASNTRVTSTGLFAKLYQNLGFLSVPVAFDSTQPSTDLAATSTGVLWSRPTLTNSQYYPYGWPEVITVGLIGAKYTTPAGQSVLKTPAGGNLGTSPDGNATLTLSAGQLSDSLSYDVNVATGNAVTIPTELPDLTMTIAPATGLITGTFPHTDDTVSNYSAVILQKGPNARACGYFLTAPPAIIDYRGESGGVSVIGK